MFDYCMGTAFAYVVVLLSFGSLNCEMVFRDIII
jgi:hypothetical protein